MNKPRIIGLETEYDFLYHFPPEIPNVKVGFNVMNNVSVGYGSFLENGSRFYVDAGGYPEYATPECLSVLDLIRWDKAGENIIFKKFGHLCDFFKNNRGWTGNTRGCHENYLIELSYPRPLSSTFFTIIGCYIIPFLISRQIFCGAGFIERDVERFFYSISQRSSKIELNYGPNTTSNRAIINTRDESLCYTKDNDKYFRLHLILGDANMSEVSTFLKVGTTCIVLRMIEDKFLNDSIFDFKGTTEVDVLRAISKDLDLKKVFLTNFGNMSAIDLQQFYLDKSRLYFRDRATADQEEIFIMDLWQHVLDKLRIDPMLLDKEIDWVIKYKIIKRYMEKYNVVLGNNTVRKIDFLYHNIDPAVGLYYGLLGKNKIRTLVKADEITRAEDSPPSNTRAWLRGKFIKAINRRHEEWHSRVGWDWALVRLPIRSPGHTGAVLEDINLDPYQYEDQRVENFIEFVNSGKKYNDWLVRQ